jgi:hypothetical protein
MFLLLPENMPAWGGAWQSCRPAFAASEGLVVLSFVDCAERPYGVAMRPLEADELAQSLARFSILACFDSITKREKRRAA